MELRLNLRGTTWETNDALRVNYDGSSSLLDPAFFVSGPFTPVFNEFFSTYIVGPAWDNPADTPYDYDFFFDLSGLPDPRGIAALTLVWLWFYNSVDAVVSARESAADPWVELGAGAYDTNIGGSELIVPLDWSLLVPPALPEFWTSFNLTYEIP